MNIKPVSIPVLDYDLAADWHDTGHDEHILYVLLGRGSSKARVAEFINDVATKAHTNALVLDNSGHGESPFAPDTVTPAQYLLETVAVFDALRTRHPQAKLSVLGTSYGGLMAAWLTRYRPMHKLVLRTPTLFPSSDFYTPLPLQDQTANTAYRADSSAVASNPLFRQPALSLPPTLLVIHGADELIPPATTDAYQQDFSAQIYVAQGFAHPLSDPRNPRDQFPVYKSAIATWLAK